MEKNRFTLIALSLILFASMAACGSLQMPLMGTPVPTKTPEPVLKCNISNDPAAGALNVGFVIVTEQVSETSPVVTTYNNETNDFTYDSNGAVSLFTVHVNRDLLYKSTGHVYHIEGVITFAPATQLLNYDITATGTALSTQQKCTR